MRLNHERAPWLYSITLHLLLLYLVLPHGSSKDQKGEEEGKGRYPQSDASKIIPKSETSESVEVTLTISPKEPASIQTPNKKFCAGKNSFGGIGIAHDLLGIVLEVVPGYPAHAAGIRVGDIVENLNDARGEPGTVAHMVIYRDGVTMKFDVVRDKICTEGTQKP